MRRYQSFGERVGAVSTLALKNDEVPQSLRNAVWNLSAPLFQQRHYGQMPPIVHAGEFLKRMALDKSWLLPDPDYRYRPDEAERQLRTLLTDPNKSAWHEVYEYLESFYRWANSKTLNQSTWEASVDAVLFQHRSLYRFTNHLLAEIASEEESVAVEQAAQLGGKYTHAAEHIGKALTLFAARPEPDYENVAKEAASAVESALAAANGHDQDMKDAATEFSSKFGVHPALMKSASNLFGYASDRDGVRHGKTGAGDAVTQEEALLVLVSASAWVNFVAAKAP